MKMRHYLFVIEDDESEYDGEEILVGASCLTAAIELAASEGFPHLRFCDELTDEEAENSGLDEL